MFAAVRERVNPKRIQALKYLGIIFVRVSEREDHRSEDKDHFLGRPALKRCSREIDHMIYNTGTTSFIQVRWVSEGKTR